MYEFLGTFPPGVLSYIPFNQLYIYIFFCAVRGPMYNVARHGWSAMKVTG